MNMEIQRWLTHTTALHLHDVEDDTNDVIICVCGDVFQFNGAPTNWMSTFEQFSEHLKKMNAPPTPLVIPNMDFPSLTSVAIRGNNEPKLEKPEGDDPRSGFVIPSHYTTHITEWMIEQGYIRLCLIAAIVGGMIWILVMTIKAMYP